MKYLLFCILAQISFYSYTGQQELENINLESPKKEKFPSFLDNYELKIGKNSKKAPGQWSKILASETVELEIYNKKTNELVSYLSYLPLPSKKNNFGTIVDMFTQKNNRNEGLATYLIMLTISQLQEKGAEGIHLVITDTYKENSEFLKVFFSKFNFDEIKNKNYPNNICMELKFDTIKSTTKLISEKLSDLL